MVREGEWKGLLRIEILNEYFKESKDFKNFIDAVILYCKYKLENRKEYIEKFRSIQKALPELFKDFLVRMLSSDEGS